MTTVTVNGGVATFSTLILNTAGTYTLASHRRHQVLNQSLLRQLRVNPNTASKLVVTTQPSTSATAGVVFGTQPVVAEEDAFSNVITSDNTSTR